MKRVSALSSDSLVLSLSFNGREKLDQHLLEKLHYYIQYSMSCARSHGRRKHGVINANLSGNLSWHLRSII